MFRHIEVALCLLEMAVKDSGARVFGVDLLLPASELANVHTPIRAARNIKKKEIVVG